jgi:TolA-binding protein
MKNAVPWIMTCMMMVAGCSKPTAEEYLARGKEAELQAHGAADTVQNAQELRAIFAPAVDDYVKLVEMYPGSELAEGAFFKIATIYNNDTHEYDKAIDWYKRYIARYPDSSKSALALFLIGYLYNNELHNFDSAAVAYRKFLEKYPQHEMAPSAQFELNTLGKPPEELLSPAPGPKEEPKIVAKRKK